MLNNKLKYNKVLAISAYADSIICIDGELFKIEKIDFTIGKNTTHAQLCSVDSGNIRNVEFNSEDEVNILVHDVVKVEYWYPSEEDENQEVFFDVNKLAEISIDREIINKKMGFIKIGEIFDAILCDNKIVGIILPRFMELEVKAVIDSSFSNNDDSRQNIKVELETGKIISVPSYIEKSDIIKIDTRTQTFVQRF